jgi:O-antigen/teichoic acid export membrane protein
MLGPERFGMWALAIVVSQSLSSQDLGIAGALMKFIPEHLSNGETNRVQELACTGLVLLGAIGFVVGLVVLVLRHWLVDILRIPQALQSEMAWLLVGMAVVFLLNLISSGLTAVLIGIHRMDASNLVYSVAALVQGGGVFFVLSRGYGLAGLTANAMLMTLIWGLLSWVMIRRFLPEFRLRFSLARRADASSLLRYGMNIQIAGLGSLLTIPPVKVLLSRYVSLASVSSFELASGMAMQLRSGFVMAAMPLIPASAQLSAERASDNIIQLYRRSVRYIALFALPVFSLAVALAPGFTFFWLGKQTPYVATTLIVLLVGWFANTLTLPAYFMLQGQGLARYQMYATAIQASSSILFSYAFIKLFGYYGAVSGLATGLSVAAGYLLWQYMRLYSGPRIRLLDRSLLTALGIDAVLLLAYLSRSEFRESSHFVALCLLTGGYACAYLLLLAIFGCLSKSELSTIGFRGLRDFARRLSKIKVISRDSELTRKSEADLSK